MKTKVVADAVAPSENLFGGGALGDLTRAFQWSETSLGDRMLWPQSLITTVNILLNSKFPMFLWWGDDLIQFYNDAYRPSLGEHGKHPTALGQKAATCWVEIWPTIYPLIERVLSGGEATWSEDQLIPIFRDGKLEDVYWTFGYSPVYDETSKIKGVLVVCNETTGKVQTLKELQYKERLISSIFTQAPVAVAIFKGPHFVIEMANEQVLEYWGRTLDQVINLPLFQALPEAAGQGFEELLTQVLQTGERVVAKELSVDLHRSGVLEKTYINFVYEPYYEIDGAVSGVMVVANEITEQVLSRQAAEASENRFRALIEATPFPMCLYKGRDMKIELVNEALLETWGRDVSVVGKTLKEAIPELKDQPFLEILDSVYSTGLAYAIRQAESRVLRNGVLGTYYHDLWYKPMFDAANHITGILATGQDVTENVLAQKTIVESERNLRNIILQAPVAICIFRGPEFVIEIANEKMIEVWGKSAEAVMNKPVFEALPEATNQGFEELVRNVYVTGNTFAANELPITLPRGGDIQTVFVNLSYQAIREADGRISGIMAMAIDVTEQVLARQKIEVLEESARLSIEAGELGTYEINLLTDEIVSSPRFDKIFDVDRSRERQPYINAIHPQDLKIREMALTTGSENIAYEIRIVTRDGSIRWVKVMGKISMNDAKIPVKLIGVIQDISSQKEKEEQIKNTSDRLQLALDAGKLGSYEYDFDTDKVTGTAQHLKNYGFTHGQEVSFEQISSLILPEDKIEMQKAMNRAIAEHGIYQSEYRIKMTDGTIRWIKSSGRAIYNKEDKPEKMVGITVDITEQKLFAAELTRQVKERTTELKRSNEDLQQFAHVASHDLKEPVRKIKTFAGRLTVEFADQMPEKAKQYLDKIKNATQRIYAMIDGVLTYSSLSNSPNIFNQVDLNEVIKNIESDLEVPVQQKGAVIITNQLPVIPGNATLIYQLFYNLINNALKFSKDAVSPIVTVSAVEADNKYAKITVSDNGIGFEEENADKIFETFSRLNPKDVYEGTGLGLALCKKIVERHGGTISAKGIVGEAAVFTILLPSPSN